MRRKPLPDGEKKICLRLKELRSNLGLSEEAAARQAGISKHLWHNFEVLRAPLRCDVALRICRQLIVSEEWLATGRFDWIEAIAGEGGEMKQIYFRQCVDLQSEPEFLQLRPGELFSNAYRDILGPKYGALVKKYYHLPRLVITDFDSDGLLCRYLTVANERYFLMLENEARRLSAANGVVRRMFLRGQIEFGEVLFKRFMGFSSPEIRGKEFDFLRAIANDPSYPLGPLHGTESSNHGYAVSSWREALSRAFNLPVSATDDELAEIGRKGNEPWQILMEMSVELAKAYAGKVGPGLVPSPSALRELRAAFAKLFLASPLRAPELTAQSKRKAAPSLLQPKSKVKAK